MGHWISRQRLLAILGHKETSCWGFMLHKDHKALDSLAEIHK